MWQKEKWMLLVALNTTALCSSQLKIQLADACWSVSWYAPCRLSSRHMSRSGSGHSGRFARCPCAWRAVQAPAAGHTSGGEVAWVATGLCDCYQKSSGQPHSPANSCSLLGQNVFAGKALHKLLAHRTITIVCKRLFCSINIDSRLPGGHSQATLHYGNVQAMLENCSWWSWPSFHIVKQPSDGAMLLLVVRTCCPLLQNIACSSTCCCGWHVAIESSNKTNDIIMFSWSETKFYR